MKTSTKTIVTVDEYIASFPPKVQAQLKKLRRLVKKVAPKAEEKISYGMPAYKLNGALVYFAAYETHIGVYALPATIKAFKKELAPYSTSKGTIRFPLDRPLPLPLIQSMIDYRMKENGKKK